MKHRIDLMSKKILAQIAKDAGCDAASVAKAVGCSVEVAEDRIRKLQEDGVIRGFRAHVDMSSLTGHHEALVVGVPSHATDPQTLRGLAEQPDVARVFTMAAQASIAFTLHGPDPDGLQRRAAELAERAALQAHRCTLIVSSLDGQAAAQVLPVTA